MVRRKNFGVLASLALIGICLNATAHAAIIAGATSTFTSSADLDLDNIIYAVNLGDSTSDQVVGGVTFSGTSSPIAGVTLNGAGTLVVPDAGLTEPNFDGGGASEDALEQVLRTLTFGTNLNQPFPLFTFETVAGVEYRLQLLMYDSGASNNRNFDIIVDGVTVVTDEPLGTPIDDDPTQGRLYTLDFVASSISTPVTFDVGSAVSADQNPVINGVTLATTRVPEPTSIVLSGLLGIALGLGRFRSRKC